MTRSQKRATVQPISSATSVQLSNPSNASNVSERDPSEIVQEEIKVSRDKMIKMIKCLTSTCIEGNLNNCCCGRRYYEYALRKTRWKNSEK